MGTHSEDPSQHVDLSLCRLNVSCITVCDAGPDIKTTLDRRFAFAEITTVISIVKSSTYMVTTDHCEHARLAQQH